MESIDAARASSYDVPERASEAGSARSGRAASAAESGAREKITLAGILDGPPPKDVLGRMLYYLAQVRDTHTHTHTQSPVPLLCSSNHHHRERPFSWHCAVI